MNFFRNKLRRLGVFIIVQVLFVLPALAIDLESTVQDNSRQNYSKSVTPKTGNQPIKNQAAANNTVVPAKDVVKENSEVKPVEIKQDLPNVPKLPKNADSSTVSPVNTKYTGKTPTADAFIPAVDIKVEGLNIDSQKIKTAQKKSAQTQVASKSQKQKVQTKPQTYRTAILPKGTQVRAVNKSKITDYYYQGQSIIFVSTQDISTSYLKLPAGTKFEAKITDAHRPQMSCNGGLVALKVMYVYANGYKQQIDAGITKIKTENIYFSNLKGEHTYCKNVAKKAKWGQKKFDQWSKTSHQLANKGAGVIIAPFPYLGGCVLAAASTLSSPVTALLAKGGSLSVPVNTVFTIKLYSDAKIRY